MSTPRNPDGETGGGGGSGGEGDPNSGQSQAPSPGLAEEYADVFDCRALDVSCHISKWFHGLVVNILDPLFGWVASKMFITPAPTEGIARVWHGTQITVNILYVLLVLAVAFVVMAHHSLQAQYGAKELLPRLVVGWVAANVSLTVVALAADVSTSIATAIVASGIDSHAAAQNLRENTTRFLEQESVAVVLFLVVFVVLFVVWLVVEIVRIVIVILLMVGGPLMLAFHALPHTNRIAQMWWRALGAVTLVPIAQAIAYVALVQVFFQGDTKAIFGMGDVAMGEASLIDLALLLVLVYVQIRIPMWAYKAVWTPPTGNSPIASMAKTAVTALVVGALTGGAGGAVAAGVSRPQSVGRILHRRLGHASSSARTTAPPRRVRTWRFGQPGAHHTSSRTTNTRPQTQSQPQVPVQPGRQGHATAQPTGHWPSTNRPPRQQGQAGSPPPPHRQADAFAASPTAGRSQQPPQSRQPQQPSHRPPVKSGSGGSSGVPHQRPHTPSAPAPRPHGQAPRPRWRRPTSWMPSRRQQGAHRSRPVFHRWWWHR